MADLQAITGFLVFLSVAAFLAATTFSGSAEVGAQVGSFFLSVWFFALMAIVEKQALD